MGERELPRGVRFHRGKYQVRWYSPEGKRVAKTFDRLTDARKEVQRVAVSKDQGTYVDPRAGLVTVADWTERWLNTTSPTLKPLTVLSYKSLLRSRVLPALGGYRLRDLKPSAVAAWVGAMISDGLSPSRIRQASGVLRQALDAAVDDGCIVRNPAARAKLPRIEHKEAPFFEPPIVDALVGAVQAPYGALVAVMGVCGLRFGEAAALRVRHVDALRRRLIVEESLAEIRTLRVRFDQVPCAPFGPGVP